MTNLAEPFHELRYRFVSTKLRYYLLITQSVESRARHFISKSVTSHNNGTLYSHIKVRRMRRRVCGVFPTFQRRPTTGPRVRGVCFTYLGRYLSLRFKCEVFEDCLSSSIDGTLSVRNTISAELHHPKRLLRSLSQCPVLMPSPRRRVLMRHDERGGWPSTPPLPRVGPFSPGQRRSMAPSQEAAKYSQARIPRR